MIFWAGEACLWLRGWAGELDIWMVWSKVSWLRKEQGSVITGLMLFMSPSSRVGRRWLLVFGQGCSNLCRNIIEEVLADYTWQASRKRPEFLTFTCFRAARPRKEWCCAHQALCWKGIEFPDVVSQRPVAKQFQQVASCPIVLMILGYLCWGKYVGLRCTPEKVRGLPPLLGCHVEIERFLVKTSHCLVSSWTKPLYLGIPLISFIFGSVPVCLLICCVCRGFPGCWSQIRSCGMKAAWIF